MEPKDRLIVGLDMSDSREVEKLCRELDNSVGILKIGLELIYSQGLDILKMVRDLGYQIFLDAKFHDIPEQGSRSCAAVAKLGVRMVTLHTLGGYNMLHKSVEKVKETSTGLDVQPPLLLGVTILTSLDDSDLEEMGFRLKVQDTVVRLADLAVRAGLDGIVCSAQEASLIKAKYRDSLIVVTPGIRPAGWGSQDQKRVVTPAEAMKMGIDSIVVGRPITEAQDRLAATRAILEEMRGLS
ncbi:orotidine-5'-phosphate decarboxylase [Candidatus Hakubella thermalkaliphila]|uniref:Orotidine 5'-phosphate decarboxylase n=1 Tax=Candidatus Hakubella thermalkaliphila TaxID=2754717 RepID=A0A6V8Q2E6_9ACTN|nr:orotidine-5'-phosphate decarboxylase [Candidatus Hakubella thermalkaliphila]GFP37576.1 orotidine-5'-phosphate decarboxylase [Candidatus Hakubella thermalkaliphila]